MRSVFARGIAALLMLFSASSQAMAGDRVEAHEPVSSSLEARINRVEQGLPTRAAKEAPVRKQTLAERMAFHQVPAVSIAVINDGKIEWARAYGMADAASQRPATTTTLFQAGSVSKPVSAIGALRLVEQGKLSLDEDVNQQLSAWQIPQSEFTRDKAVTLRGLLNHSAGITVHGFGGYSQGQVLPTLVQILQGVAPANSDPVRVDVAPGSLWRYSGGGYSIIQLMIIEASGQTFDQYMKTDVLDRMGMTLSTFAAPLPQAQHAVAATAYDANGKPIAGLWHNYPESAAAGLWTTASDLARVVIEVQQSQAGTSDNMLSSAMTSSMLTRGLGEYGLGFFVEDLGEHTSFSHGGGTTGFRAKLYGYTGSGQGIVVLTNSDNGMALIDEIIGSVAAEYDWPEFQ